MTLYFVSKLIWMIYVFIIIFKYRKLICNFFYRDENTKKKKIHPHLKDLIFSLLFLLINSHLVFKKKGF